MTSAYRFASEGQKSPEIEKIRRIERFGLEAVTGRRVFGHAEYIRMITAENIANAYFSRKLYKDSEGLTNWAEWGQRHPEAQDLLNAVEVLSNEEA